MCIDYDPGDFYKNAHNRYPEAWRIISSQEARRLLVEMANQGQPVVGALLRMPRFLRLVTDVDSDSPELSHNFRRMSGHMCGRVMEYLGYSVEREGVSLDDKSVFQEGSVFSLRE